MASSGIIAFIFTFLCINTVNSDGGEFVKVEYKTANVGHYGQQSLLECVIKTSTVAKDATIRVVTWKKLTYPEDEDGLPLVVFAKGELNKKSGYKFAEPSWDKTNMNVSLLITNTTVAHDGYYKCMVITDSGDDSMVTTLKVQARYSVPTVRSIPEKIIQNTDSTLVCESRGGYPNGTLRWFDEKGHEWTKSSEMEVTQSSDSLFQLTSRLSLLRGSTFPTYACIVFNASGGKEDGITIAIPIFGEYREDPRLVPSKIVAPLVVIGSLIVGLLCVLVLCRRRFQRGHGAAPTDVEEAGYNSHEDEPINQDQS